MRPLRILLAIVMLFAGAMRAAQAGSEHGSPPALHEWAYVYDYTDRIDRIAAACGTSATAVLSVNRLRVDQLRDGQALSLPPPLEGTLPAFLTAGDQMRREVWRGVRGKKRVALTFDSGGDPHGADEVLATLRETGTPVTFFPTGDFARKHPDIIAAMARDGHPVHNHTWSHPDMTKLSAEQIANELARTEDILTSMTGMSTRPFWRPPFGARDRRVLRVAAEAGYQSIYWTIDTLDSVPPPKTRDMIVRRVLNPPAAKGNADDFLDGAIILMHFGKVETARALPIIIEELRGRGFTLVTVDEILERPSLGR